MKVVDRPNIFEVSLDDVSGRAATLAPMLTVPTTITPVNAGEPSEVEARTQAVTPIAGALSTVLGTRWLESPTTLIDTVCAPATVDEALQEAVALLHGARAFVFGGVEGDQTLRVVYLLDTVPDTIHLDPVPGVVGGVAVPAPVGAIGRIVVPDGAAAEWAHYSDVSERARLMGRLLGTANIAALRLHEALGGAPPWLSQWRTHWAIALWWNARMNEGCTPHTARTLLSLLLHPATLALITEWPHDGDRQAVPVLTRPRISG